MKDAKGGGAGTSCMSNQTGLFVGAPTTGLYGGGAGFGSATSGDDGAITISYMLQPIVPEMLFNPSSILTGQSSTLVIVLKNPNSTDITSAGFTLTYPAGMVNSTPSGVIWAYSRAGSATAADGGNSVTLSGGLIPANSVAYVNVKVRLQTNGRYVVTLPQGAVTTSNAGSNTVPATATLSTRNPGTFWDGQANDSTTVEGGNGTWAAGTNNWTNSGGSGDGPWAGGTSIATFAGTGGTVNVSGTQDIGGLTFTSGGYTLQGGTLNGTASINTLTLDTGASALVYSVLAGGNAFATDNQGTIRFLGTNTYTGATLVQRGSLSIGIGGTSGSIDSSSSIILANNTRIEFFRSDAYAVTQVISGYGSVIAAGSGVITLSADNTYTGKTIVGGFPLNINYGGTLSLGNGGTSGSIDSSSDILINASAKLVFNRSDAYAATKVISDPGAVIQAGSGITTLSGANTYTGTTTVSAGTLRVNGNQASATGTVTVSSGATLGGNGTLGGVVTINSGGHLSPGNSPGTITMAGLSLPAGANLDMELGQANVVGGSLNDRVQVNGNLSLGGGTLNISVPSGLPVASGTYRLIDYTGTLAASSFVMGAIPANSSEAKYVIDTSTPNQVNLIVSRSPRVRVDKVSNGGVGSFNFALNGLSATADRITTSTPGVTAQGTTTLTGTPGTAASVTESGAPSGWPENPAAASCVDTNGAASGNGAASFGTLTGNLLTIAAGNMRDGAIVICTFTNNLRSVLGTVFKDNGAPAGGSNTAAPNDGLQNGSESGLAGLAVNLTNCAGATYASANTDNNGGYSLYIPSTVADGSSVCVSAGLPANYLATGANAGGAVTPDGSATTVGSITYTYSRAQQRQAFAAPASGITVLNFGAVAPSTFALGAAQMGQPGTSVIYPHTFTAQTGGTVSFSIASSTPNPAQTGWSERIYEDTGCTGVRQSGAVVLYPPVKAITVVAGQQVCVLVQQIIPGSLTNGYTNTAVVQANLNFSNAAPSLFATYLLSDLTTVGGSALSLNKAVRNVTQNVTTWGVSNQAKSGEVLEYRVTYTNNTAAPMTKVVLSDAIPAYTKFQSATAGPVPAGGGNCTMNTPVNPEPAAPVACSPQQTGSGTGNLRWSFDGSLNPSATGYVEFRVLVD